MGQPVNDSMEAVPPGVRRAGLIAGPLLALGLQGLVPPAGLSAAAWVVVSLALLMALWWLTEAVPMAVTALLPVAVLPLTGVTTLDAATAPYAEPIIFLLLGGFLVALSIERWGLHRRIALAVLGTVGTSPARLVLGFMLATAFLSMWMSNSAATMMVAPIALSVAAALDDRKAGAALLLGVAYAASLGGMATIIGTPPNALAVGYLKTALGREVGFLDWMRFGVPVLVCILPLAWLVLTRLAFRLDSTESAAAGAAIAAERAALGPMARAERRTALLCLALAAAWSFQPLLKTLPGLGGLSDAGLAIGFAILMFLAPSGGRPGERLLDWTDTAGVNWGIILLFGGGLSLAGAIEATGLAQWLGGHLVGLTQAPALVLALALALGITLLSEIASNTALAAAMLPVLGATAQASGTEPLGLILPATLAASCGFMLPVATGPNAIVFGTGKVRAADMMRAGLLLDLVGAVAIALIGTLLLG